MARLPIHHSHQSFLVGFATEALKRLGVVAVSEIIAAMRDFEKQSVPSGTELKAYRDELATIANATTPS